MMLWWTYQQLRSSNLNTRLAAVTKLAEFNQPDSVEPLLFALKDKETEIRSAAARALGHLQDKRVVEPLVKMLRDPVPLARATAAEALGQLREPSAIGWLVSLLRDPDVTVRLRAARSLERLGWHPATEDERTWYMVATGNLNRVAELGADGVQPLVELMRNGPPEKQVSAVKALGQIADPRIPGLMREALRSGNVMVRLAALEKLEQLADPDSYEAVERLLHDQGSNIRAAAATAAVSCGGSRAVPKLVVMLKDASWEVRHEVVKALGSIGDATAIDGLAKALSDRDHDVRESAATALGRIGDAQAIRPLVLALMDVESFVRTAANNSLNEIQKHWERTAEARSMLPQIRAALKHREYWISHSAAKLLELIPDTGEADIVAAPPAPVPASHPAKSPPHAAFAILADLLRDRDRDLRLAAAQAFGQLREKGARPNLAHAIKDNNARVRQAAEQALAALN
jgi:HEAT repeat protein